MNTITTTPFGGSARLFTLGNGVLSASFTDLGATLVSLKFMGRETVLGYGSAEDYLRGTASVGATVGRFAGRIENARFSLGGREFVLPANNGKNHLHGCFGRRFFEVDTEDDGLVLTLVSPDGEEGFPGELVLRVHASLEGSALKLRYEARTDSETVLNITNHSYFNLNGGGSVRGQRMRLYSESFAEVRDDLIPTGRLLPVRGTPLDFTEERPIDSVLDAKELAATRGLDHSFCLPGEGMKRAAELYSPESGIRMTVSTTQPTVHVYTAGFFDPMHGGVCFETQHFPNSPNIPSFPPTVLKKGELFTETTVFGFTHS